MKKSFFLMISFVMVIMLSGCSKSVSTPEGSVKVDENGVEVNSPGGSVKTGENGTSVSTPDGMGVETGSAQTDAPSSKKKNLLVIMDASGSMNEMIAGERKIDIAKKSINSYIEKMGTVDNFGIYSYGQTGSNSQADKTRSCESIENVYYLGSVNKEIAKSKVNAVSAKGWTPIAKSLQKAQEILSAYPNDENRILLVSDGEETCGGNPVEVAKVMKGLNMKIDVLGFDVSGNIEQQLKNISVEGGGGYVSVKNGNDFSLIINNGSLEAITPGAYVNIQGGTVNVKTDGAVVNTNGSNTKVETDMGTVDTSKPNAGVSVPNVTIPKY